MGKKVAVPGKGMYGEATAWMRKNQTYTKSHLVEMLQGKGLSDSAADATAVVMLSPRLESNRGDCRGNMSNPWGHLAYNDKLKRKEVDGVKEEQKFRFRLRKEALEPRKRVLKSKVEASKVKVGATEKATSDAVTA